MPHPTNHERVKRFIQLIYSIEPVTAEEIARGDKSLAHVSYLYGKSFRWIEREMTDTGKLYGRRRVWTYKRRPVPLPEGSEMPENEKGATYRKTGKSSKIKEPESEELKNAINIIVACANRQANLLEKNCQLKSELEDLKERTAKMSNFMEFMREMQGN